MGGGVSPASLGGGLSPRPSSSSSPSRHPPPPPILTTTRINTPPQSQKQQEAAALEAAIAAANNAATATSTVEEAAATRTVDDLSTTTTTEATTTTDSTADTPEAMLAAAARRHAVFRAPVVAAALRLAARLHSGSAPRASGEPLLAHCVSVATILAELGLGEDLVAAGLLHDALGPRSALLRAVPAAAAAPSSSAAPPPPTPSPPPPSAAAASAALVAGAGDPSCSVPPGVAALVERVERLSEASRLYRDNAHAIAAAAQLDLLTSADDAAALLVSLADRLADMRTLRHLPRARQVRLARETAGVHAVLASRLGAWRVKAELEDLAFAALQPEQHGAASALVAARAEAVDLPRRVREAAEALRAAGIEVVDVSGRVKHARGAAKKLGRGASLDDVVALRVVVPGKHDCYAALRALETVAWPGASVPGRFKDYIRERKANGYQSLHYVVELPSSSSASLSASGGGAGVDGGASAAAASATNNTVRFEVQIRTPKMHYLAEYGMAAHWRYKEAAGGTLDSADGSPGAAAAAAAAREARGSGSGSGSGGRSAPASAADAKAAADKAEWLDRLVQWKRWVVANKLGLATESGKARAAMLADTDDDAAASTADATTTTADAALRALGLPSVLDAETCPQAAAAVDPLLLHERFRVKPVTEGDAATRPVPVLVSGPRGARVVDLPPRTTAAQLLRAAAAAAGQQRPPALDVLSTQQGEEGDADTEAAAAALEKVLLSPAASAAAAQQRARLAAAAPASRQAVFAPSAAASSAAPAPLPARRWSRPPSLVAVLVNGVAVEAGSAAAEAPLRPGDLVSLVAAAGVGAAPPQRPAYAAVPAAAAAAVPAAALV
jgi:ppGpp synthetase/RelA/SpoT-type nucleotidyltranferase